MRSLGGLEGRTDTPRTPRHGGPTGEVLGVYRADADVTVSPWEGLTHSAGSGVGCR